MIKNYLSIDGVECVIIENEDGTTWSGLKSACNEMLKQAEQSTPSVNNAD
jgi:hypothetical protein